MLGEQQNRRLDFLTLHALPSADTIDFGFEFFQVAKTTGTDEGHVKV